MGGLQTGDNWQFAPSWVFGVETDNSFGDLKKSGLASGGLASSVKIDDFGTIRARLGYTIDRVMLYATGGLAYGRERVIVATVGPTTTKLYDIGWTIGGGLEYGFAPGWSAKVEYLYADLGGSRNAHAAGAALSSMTTDLTTNVVRAGLNYKFDLADFLRGH
jgi:outer membrane immunogenic protein